MRRIGVLLTALFIFSAASPSHSQTVMNTSDAGPGSLRAVVAAATSGAVIVFDSALAGQTITLTSGEVVIGTHLTLDGADRRIRISGGNTVRLFNVSPGTNVTIANLTLTNGLAPGAFGRGGAIFNQGVLTLRRSTLSNHSAYNGGAIDNRQGCTLVAEQCTFASNTANGNSGGAIINTDRATATFTNCTFSGNAAIGTNREGGAILNYNDGTGPPILSLVNCTLSNNNASGKGGAISNSNGQVTLFNTIVGANTAPTGPNLFGTFTSNGTNLFSSTSGATIVGPGAGTDLVTAPGIDFLGDYGGPTQTVPLFAQSSARNAGTLAGAPSVDQRGIPRAGAPDIGAFELTAVYVPLPFATDWADTTLIATQHNWVASPGVLGLRGDNPGTTADVNPQTILIDLGPPQVTANQSNPSGVVTPGVAEFHIANPVVALAASGVADAPAIVLHLDASGCTDIRVSYLLRDIDASTRNTVQAVAMQYRTTVSGSWTNVPAAFVADATAGPNAMIETPVSVQLPADANDVATLHVRIMTSNAAGDDEWVGVDDIRVEGCLPSDTEPAPGMPRQLALIALPNPFNATTAIQFDLSRAGSVALAIYAIDGRRVNTLLHGAEYTAGRHRVVWNGVDDSGRGVTSGVYLCRLESGGSSATRRLVIVK